jgi:hypothetical protein
MSWFKPATSKSYTLSDFQSQNLKRRDSVLDDKPFGSLTNTRAEATRALSQCDLSNPSDASEVKDAITKLLRLSSCDFMEKLSLTNRTQEALSRQYPGKQTVDRSTAIVMIFNQANELVLPEEREALKPLILTAVAVLES